MKEQAQALLNSETVKNALTLLVFGVQKTPTQVDDQIVFNSTEFLDAFVEKLQELASNPITDEEAKNAGIDLLVDGARLTKHPVLIKIAEQLDKRIGDGPDA